MADDALVYSAGKDGAGCQQLPSPGNQKPSTRACGDGPQRGRIGGGGVHAEQVLCLGSAVASGVLFPLR